MAALAAHALACAALAQETRPSTPPQAPPAAQKGDGKTPTAEQVAETVIFAYGVRERLAQVRRTALERGRITRTAEDGRTEEITYERSFKRGETFEKDKIRLDQRRPSAEYSLVFNEGSVFGVVRGTPFTPREEEVATFLSDRRHGLDKLLRYKESEAAVTLAGKETHKGVELWLLDLEDKEKNRTRYFVSAKSYRVLWLEYEEPGAAGAKPTKFRRTFHDYRNVQGTYVPYRSLLYMGDRQLEESQVLTVTYGVKLEDAVFQRPESASALP
ncbi:MAG: hypothetical protein M3416_14945 [Acidobacteriota bacterium]|nr:hypothetical protein [Acidobacteriota bacterium]